jgi:hypothetical protein
MESAVIVVKNDQQWAGDPRLGAMSIYVDGRKAGQALPRAEAKVTVSVGDHSVSVRQWWFRSEPVNLSVGSGEVATVSAQRPSGMAGFLRFALHPLSALTVQRQ